MTVLQPSEQCLLIKNLINRHCVLPEISQEKIKASFTLGPCDLWSCCSPRGEVLIQQLGKPQNGALHHHELPGLTAGHGQASEPEEESDK